ncbi:hypothetical protein BDZ90DRAFT_229339 [Jaminaea rosea]|uniref:Uncharacterized protein n=1 Tax=Jaminaea rosea TaxID=1569628 RepID=A0A316UZY1_9BASI|nr:hypothetical protein BDZ90DRAFT_229339 [Jaminaea rosea]PWN30318.1 hypothetical protein BDZ90DRAFT_229339 [Jaminaea rosea]
MLPYHRPPHSHSAGPNIVVEGGGIEQSAHTGAGRWYLMADTGAKGTATGCGGSTITWSFFHHLSTYKGLDTAKTRNDRIQGFFNTNSGNMKIKGVIDSTDPEADLYLSCYPPVKDNLAVD